MSKALEIAARLKNKYYCVNTIHGLQSDIENVVEILRLQDDDINRLRALNAELVDALEPFAACCEQIKDDEDNEEWAKFNLLILNYRKARAALAKAKEQV